MVVVIVALILTYVPLESTALTKTADTNDCGDSSPCPEVAVEFTVGDSRFATLTGTWVSSSTGEDILVTINNGPSDQACTLCSDLLYTSLSSTLPTGSFDVSGHGPFHVSVSQIGFVAQTTSVQGTLDSTVI